MDKEYNLSPLTKNEISLILECLLTNGSINICSNWYDEHFKAMLNLAKKIRKNYPEILTTNLTYCDSEIENNVDNCDQMFPEINQLNFNI